MTTWGESEAVRFLVAAHGERLEALFHLALKTAMRQGELLGLKWSDMDWTDETLRVQRQVQRIPRKGFVLVEPKTRAGRRTIQLAETTLLLLRLHRERQEARRNLAGSAWQ